MKTRIIALVAISVFLSSCTETTTLKIPKEVIHSKAQCPKFDYSISISVQELNSTHAAIKWVDVTKIENMLKRKKEFNNGVEDLNGE